MIDACFSILHLWSGTSEDSLSLRWLEWRCSICGGSAGGPAYTYESIATLRRRMICGLSDTERALAVTGSAGAGSISGSIGENVMKVCSAILLALLSVLVFANGLGAK